MKARIKNLIEDLELKENRHNLSANSSLDEDRMFDYYEQKGVARGLRYVINYLKSDFL